MYKDEITKQCELMSDRELVAALTIDKHEYSVNFQEAAQIELVKRDVRLSEYTNKVRFRINDKEEIGTINEALAKLNQEFSLFDVLAFINCLDESLIFQKQSDFWIGHYFCMDKYEISFFSETSQNLEEILYLFLNLKDWNKKIDEEFRLTDWIVLESSESPDYVENVTNFLAELEIPSIVMNFNFTHYNPIGGSYYIDESIKILVPQDFIDDAQEALDETEYKIDDLYVQASKLHQSGDVQKELSILTQLAKLVPNDETVHFNRGVILYELRRYKEAADSFIASLTNNNNNYLELFNDSLQYLEQIEKVLPDDVEVLHNLATFSRVNEAENSVVEHYYRKILSIVPEDALAHLNLGYLYYEDSDDISAYHHFKKYLELEPESDQRATIESIMGK